MTPEKLRKLVDSVDTGKYSISGSELKMLHDEQDQARALIMAYKYGFLLGQRAERAKLKRDNCVPLDIAITAKGYDALREMEGAK